MRTLLIMAILQLAACTSLNCTDASIEPTQDVDSSKDKGPDSALVPIAGNPQMLSFSTQRIITCQSGDDIRTVRIELDKGSGCKLLYTRNGTTQTIAHHDHDSAYCGQALEKFTHNLIRANYTCM